MHTQGYQPLLFPLSWNSPPLASIAPHIPGSLTSFLIVPPSSCSCSPSLHKVLGFPQASIFIFQSLSLFFFPLCSYCPGSSPHHFWLELLQKSSPWHPCLQSILPTPSYTGRHHCCEFYLSLHPQGLKHVRCVQNTYWVFTCCFLCLE